MKIIFIILAILVMGIRDDDRVNACPYKIKIHKGTGKPSGKTGANFLLRKMQV